VIRATLLDMLDRTVLMVDAANPRVRGGWETVMMVRVPELHEAPHSMLCRADSLIVALQEAVSVMAEDWALMDAPAV
jgi:hypothetical protein